MNCMFHDEKYRYISCFYLKLKLKTTIFIRIQVTYSSFLFLFQCQSFIHSFNVVSSTWTISCLNARYKNIKETEAHLQATSIIRFAYILWFAIIQILQSSNLFFHWYKFWKTNLYWSVSSLFKVLLNHDFPISKYLFVMNLFVME